MTINNDVVTDKRTIAIKFNKYFSSLARNLNNSIIADKNKVPAFDRYLPKLEPSSLFLEDTNSDKVIDIINEFKTDKSSDIPIIVVKHCAPVIAYTLFTILSVNFTTNAYMQALSRVSLNMAELHLYSKKVEKTILVIIGPFQPYVFLERYLKKYYINAYIVL